MSNDLSGAHFQRFPADGGGSTQMENSNVQLHVIYQSRILSTAKYLAQLNSSQLMHSTVQIVVSRLEKAARKKKLIRTQKRTNKHTEEAGSEKIK